MRDVVGGRIDPNDVPLRVDPGCVRRLRPGNINRAKRAVDEQEAMPGGRRLADTGVGARDDDRTAGQVTPRNHVVGAGAGAELRLGGADRHG